MNKTPWRVTLGGDLSRLIRRYPLPALLIGLGIGHLRGRSSGG
jgi:hypothetical protein